ncbi:16447_t:CDS:2 [Racocetra persica]|uniref:16447_t:CDS:1 n=1 Tax=Racocetra persica TaxID=160502 RepID=A0ACA9KYN5_9GLOM|nr:16447_t:CDS:2 [Racocetra persica]
MRKISGQRVKSKRSIPSFAAKIFRVLTAFLLSTDLDNSVKVHPIQDNLKRKVDSFYDIEKAKKEFENITSPSFCNLTEYFKDIVNKNLSSKIYYRYNSNCDITNHLSSEQFSLSKESTLKFLSDNYNLAEWF